MNFFKKKKQKESHYTPQIFQPDEVPIIQTSSVQEKEETKQNMEPEEIPDLEYNDRLEKDQQLLKRRITDNHQQSTKQGLRQMALELQKDENEIIALFLADNTFNNLVILTDLDRFFQLLEQAAYEIDFTYLYALKENGSQYYGIDEYMSVITNLFENIGQKLKSSIYITPEDIRAIPGINIFHHIYLDFEDDENLEM